MEFNEKLQELRRQKGLTQGELAEAIYVSRTAVSKWESGSAYPEMDKVLQICKIFNLNIAYLNKITIFKRNTQKYPLN